MNLELKSNPQISYKGRVIRGKATVGKQTKVGEVAKIDLIHSIFKMKIDI